MDALIQPVVGALGGACLLYGLQLLIEHRRQQRQRWNRCHAPWRNRR